jgi:hypothetical protein
MAVRESLLNRIHREARFTIPVERIANSMSSEMASSEEGQQTIRYSLFALFPVPRLQPAGRNALFGRDGVGPEQRATRLLAEPFLRARIAPAILVVQREQSPVAEVEPQHVERLIGVQSLTQCVKLREAPPLRAIAPHLPVFLATRLVDAVGADDLLAAGVSEVINRPVKSGEVAAALMRCLAIRSLPPSVPPHV